MADCGPLIPMGRAEMLQGALDGRGRAGGD